MRTRNKKFQNKVDNKKPIKKNQCLRCDLAAEQKSDEYIKDFLKRLEDNLQKILFISNDSSIVIAVSGGVDSVSLLDAMSILSTKLGYRLYVAHFNHKLRQKSADDDEKYVKVLAKSYEKDFHSSKGNVRTYAKENALSIEHAARDLRYSFLEHLTKTLQADYLATAHTKDDSVETFFLNLFRGSGLTGLAGIPQRRFISKSSSIIRPFLIFSKDEIIEYANRRKLEWREDESNSLLNFTRNKIRNDLIPKLIKDYSPSIIDTVKRSAFLIWGADKFIKQHVKHFLNDAIDLKQKTRFSLKISVLDTFDDFIQGEIIQKAISDILKLSPLSLQSTDMIISLKDKSVGSICEVNKNLTVLKDREHLLFYSNKHFNPINMIVEKEGVYECGNNILTLKKISKRNVKFNKDASNEFFDYDLLPYSLQLRNIQPQDKFQPLGMSENVNITDFLTNLKVPYLDKQNIVVLAAKSEIVWICGYRISEKFKISSNTTNYLKGEFTQKES